MFTWMRTHQRNLMLVITILTIISLTLFYSTLRGGRTLGPDVMARMYDHDVSRGEFEHAMRGFDLALSVGLTDYASQLSGGSEQGQADFAVNTMIIDHEGKKLGLKPTDDDVKNAIMAMPAFQTGGQFDPRKYSAITQIALAPKGLSEDDLANLVANSLMFDRIKKMLDSAPAVTDAEVSFLSRIFQPVDGLAVSFSLADYARNVKITDAQVADFFKANAASLVTPEWRTARYVQFPLPVGIDKLQGKAKVDAQQKVADASDAFATKAAAEGFDKAAADAGLKIETTLPFDHSGNTKIIGGLNGGTDVSGPARALAPAVFTLSEKSPVSGIVQSDNNFLVADLGNVEPSRAKTLDEARAEIVQQLTDAAAQAAAEKGSTDALAALRAAVKSGKPFAQAAAAAGLKTQPFANVSLSDEATPADQRKYADSAMMLEENEISGLRREPEGGYVVWLEKRHPIDQKKFADHRADLESGILQQRQLVLWSDWIRAAQKDSGMQFANPRSSDQG